MTNKIYVTTQGYMDCFHAIHPLAVTDLFEKMVMIPHPFCRPNIAAPIIPASFPSIAVFICVCATCLQ